MSHMKGSVNYGQVADEIAQILADYGDHAVKVLNEEAEKSGEALCKGTAEKFPERRIKAETVPKRLDVQTGRPQRNWQFDQDGSCPQQK